MSETGVVVVRFAVAREKMLFYWRGKGCEVGRFASKVVVVSVVVSESDLV